MKISVIGLGKLGLSLVTVLTSRGFHVIGVDVDPVVVEAVNARCVPERIYEPGLAEMLEGIGENLIATDDIEAVQHTNVTIVLVPTPSDDTGGFSLEYVLDVCNSLSRVLRDKDSYHLVVIASTVMPGDCDGPIREALEASGKKVGKSLGLCYCPEFVALGDVIRGFLEPDFVLIGASGIRAAFLLTNLYKKFCLNDPPIARTNLANAEIAKIALNCYITTKITFANQLAELCEHIPDTDVDVVTGVLALDSRIGCSYLTGATAYGGPCFPRDTRSFVCAAERVRVQLPLIENIDWINRWQVERLAKIVQGERERIQAEKIGILGLTYKPETNVIEESAGAALLELLENVIAFDPAVQIEQSVESAQTCADWSDIVVVTTPWPEFREIQFHEGQVVIDCWRMLNQEKIEWAGAEYLPLGRYHAVEPT